MDDEDVMEVEVYNERKEHWKEGSKMREKKQKEEHWEKKMNSTTFYTNPVSSGALVESLILICF